MRILCVSFGILLFSCAAFGQVQDWSPDGVAPGKIHFGNPSRPAVLLFHGLGQTGTSTWIQPSLMGANWDYTTNPATRSLGPGHSKAGVGVLEFGLSNPLAVDSRNFFDALANAGFTVAEWDQPGITFAQALPSALAAFDKFVVDTRAVNPSAPPPIALIGHSRGGLLIRSVLIARGSVGRVRWVITLHSPHGGSDMASFASRCGTDWTAGMNVGPLNGQRDAIIAALRAASAPIDAQVNKAFQAELAPGSPLITGLATRERKLPFVRYVTFGGTSPRYVRTYAWGFTPASAFPSGHDNSLPPRPTFTWTVVANEMVPFASPMLDIMPHCTPELTPGVGDGLVSDARSHLSFEDRHVTDSLNHAEVLWNTTTERIILAELSQQLTPIPITMVPATAQITFGTVSFAIDPPRIVGVSCSLESGPGWVTQTGQTCVYHAPPPRACTILNPCPSGSGRTAVVRATAQDNSGRVARATVTLN